MPLPDLFTFIANVNPSPSDWLLVLCVFPAAWFFASYGLGSPWYRSLLGIVTFLHSFSVLLLLGLIVYAIVFGQRVDEPFRVIIAALLLFALTSKAVILHVERRAGRIERRELRLLKIRSREEGKS